MPGIIVLLNLSTKSMRPCSTSSMIVTLAFHFLSPTSTRLSMTMWLPHICQSTSISISMVMSLGMMRACTAEQHIDSSNNTTLTQVLHARSSTDSAALCLDHRSESSSMHRRRHKKKRTVALSISGGMQPSDSSRRVICDNAMRNMGFCANDADSLEKRFSNCEVARLLTTPEMKPGQTCFRIVFSQPASCTHIVLAA